MSISKLNQHSNLSPFRKCMNVDTELKKLHLAGGATNKYFWGVKVDNVRCIPVQRPQHRAVLGRICDMIFYFIF